MKLKRCLKSEIEIEKRDKIVDIVKKILQFNRQNEGLKILTRGQMLSKLPITLA